MPLHSAEHFYVVTEQIEGVHRDLPILRDPDGYTYFKEEVGGLVVGGFEPEAKPWVAPDQLPYPFEFQLLDEDWDHFSVLMESALHRIPALHHTGIKKFYNGPESFTPDNQFILGEAPELRGLLRRRRASTRSASPRPAAPVGRWPSGSSAGEPTSDLSAMDIRRFAAVQRQQPVAARPGRRDPRAALRGALARPRARDRPGRSGAPPSTTCSAAAGASFGSKMGWERANVFAPPGVDAGHRLLLGQAELAGLVARPSRPPRATAVARLRPDLVRQDPGQGPRRRAAAAVAVHGRRRRRRRAGSSTPGCSTSAAATRPTSPITRLAHDEYLLVTGSASIVRDLAWIDQHIAADAHVVAVDVTSSYAVFGVMGPALARPAAGADPQPTCPTRRSRSPPAG